MKVSSYKKGMFDIPTVMLLSLNRLGNISFINKKGCEILGYSQKEIIGLNWFDHFIKEEMRKEIKGVFFQLISNKIKLTEHYENPVLTKSGEERIISFHNAIIYNDDNDEIVGIFSSGNDITEQHLATEQLKESELTLRSVFECAQDGMLIADLESKKFYLGNNKICSMLGYSKEELLQLSIFDIHPKESHELVFRNVSLLAQKKIDLATDIPVKRKDGGIFYADISGGDLTVQGKKCLLGIFRDTTKKREYLKLLEKSKPL
jgi:PAS domain S-box-containing protein